MTSLLVLIPVSLLLALIGLGAFVWAMRTHQFDDPDGNAWRVIAQDRTLAAHDPAAQDDDTR